jgi:nucleoside-triphosphatase
VAQWRDTPGHEADARQVHQRSGRTTPTRILLTGSPGCGKTTVIRRTVASLNRRAAGFYTEEVRDGKQRVGFDVVTLGGERGRLSRVGIPGPNVGKYGVDVRSFERVGIAALERGLDDPETLLVLDELGRMEFSSRRFVELLPEVFRAPNPLLGTIMRRAHPVADRYRARPGVEVVEVTSGDREELAQRLAARFAR